MLHLSYTISSDLRELLRRIDVLRINILSVPLSPDDELIVRWESKINRIQGSLALANIRLTRRDIELALTRAPKKLSSLVLGYKQALDWIENSWIASPRTIGPGTIETFREYVYVGPLSPYKRTESSSIKSIRELMNYLENQTEHPIVHAGIAMGMLSGSILAATDPGLVSRLLAVTFLAKDGYDLRSMASVEYEWAKEVSSYHTALSTITTQGNLNHWLLFFAESVEANYLAIAKGINSPHLRNSSSKLSRLTDRERAMLHLLDNPDESLTNKMVQKRFKVSQITASRDLSRLTTLGLLYPHGKGRSVYYTKI